MVSTEIFWQQIGAYNQATLPVQMGLMILAWILLLLIFTKPTQKTNVLTKLFLALAFAWNGVVFFLIYAKNPISNFIGAPLFILLAILFIRDIFTKKTEYKFPKKSWQKCFTIFWLLLSFFYPIIGFFLGHYYPKTCTPVMPCPLTVFAIALIAAAIPRVDKMIFVLLLPWALLALPKCLGALDCYEDCFLFGAGIYGLALLVKNWRKIGKRTAL